MKISKLEINNFRLLKKFTLDLEDDLSLIIGKNNCGKTSLLILLQQFLGNTDSNPSFKYEDLNNDVRNNLENKIIGKDIVKEGEELGISLLLYIKYDACDNLANVRKLIKDLNVENKIIVLEFKYCISSSHMKHMKEECHKALKKKRERESKKEVPHGKRITDDEFISKYVAQCYKEYFKPSRKSLRFDRESNSIDYNDYTDLDNPNDKIKLANIIRYRTIKARRNVENKDNNNTLSQQSSYYYDYYKGLEGSQQIISQFDDIVMDTDRNLTEIYDDIFEGIKDRIKTFGGARENDSILQIVSTLQHDQLLKGNTKVVFNCDSASLPENHNGLGYLNLISIIFEIELIIHEMKKAGNQSESPSDINLLFIEEPEAHTHPQMQYIFIKNIHDVLKELKDDGGDDGLNMQTLITTHSSHITSESKFDDIKYLYKVRGKNEVKAKNLKDLKKLYIDESKSKDENKEGITYYKFLKKYLTINNAELFFADKAIFIEGDTERILLPTMMKKIDESSSDKDNKLLSQNISVLQVGNYAHVFEKLIDFLDVKSLIITDFDYGVDGINRKSKYDIAKRSFNPAIKYFFKVDRDHLANKKFEDKALEKREGVWKPSVSGMLRIAYQTKEKDYIARSFEDAFIHLNREFIKENNATFMSISNIDNFNLEEIDAYDLANEKCAIDKSSFAIEILLNSDEKYSNWDIPSYIEKGLLWIRD